MVRKFIAYFLLLVFSDSIILYAQNKEYALSVIKTLCSEEMAGRGYVRNGDSKAADFIKLAFRKNGLIPLADNYFQRFNFPVITYPNEPDIIADGVSLVPGYEVLINPGCNKIFGTFKVIYADSATIDNNGLYKNF